MAFSQADLTVWGMTKKVMRDEGGVRALYRGLIPTAMGVAPYVGELEPPSTRIFDTELFLRQVSTSRHTKHYVA